MGPPTILTTEEENLLVRWIKAMAQKGFPINKNNLAQTVHDIISNDKRPTPFKDNLPGRAWMEGFLKRHKDISQRNSENIDIARSRVTEKDIKNWHSGLHDYLEAEKCLDILDDPDRIINCDEAGFQTNPSSGIILGPTGMNNLYGITENSKESITVLGTFAASGKVLPPSIVYPYARIPRDIAANINKEWSVGKSKNGWMTCKVFHGYIANTLLPALHKEGTKFPVLLLVDGHRSHISAEVSKLCNENGIILYALYPNSTHILQPADVSVFRPLKNNWRSVVQQHKLKTGTRVLTRALFAPLLEEAFKAATVSTISNGFRKCSLYPFDANAIDYSRCINDKSRHEAANKPVEVGPEHLLYIESLMRKGRAQEFRAQEEEDWQGDDSAKELFYVWRKLKKQVQAISGRTELNHEKNNHNISKPIENLVPDNNQHTSKPCLIDLVTSESLEQQQSESSDEMPAIIDCDLKNIPVGAESLEKPIQSEDAFSGNQPLEYSSDIQINIQSGNKTPQKTSNTPKDSRKGPIVPISPAFVDAIVWPTESPIKHGKKKSKTKFPDAISSLEWIKYWEVKDMEKQNKEEKKVARAEKRKMNQELKIKTSKKLAKNRRTVIYSSDSEDDEVLSKVADHSNKSTKKQKDNYEIGKYVIVKYEGEYFPGVIEQSETDYKKVSVMVLSTPNTFKWPDKPDAIWYKNEDIIEVIEPPCIVNPRGFYKIEEMAKYLPKP